MCELTFIEYNPTFDSIMPFPCFLMSQEKLTLIFNNCHLLMAVMIGYIVFLEMSKKCWAKFRVRNTRSTVASKKFWSSMSFQNVVRLSQIKKNPWLIMSMSIKCQKKEKKMTINVIQHDDRL
jgi:hypothetical protein